MVSESTGYNDEYVFIFAVLEKIHTFVSIGERVDCANDASKSSDGVLPIWIRVIDF